MIIIPYILFTLLSGLSALSGFPCCILVLCVNTGTFVCGNMNVLSTQALSSVPKMWCIKGCLHEKTRAGASFTPRWLFDYASPLHDSCCLKKWASFLLILDTSSWIEENYACATRSSQSREPIWHSYTWICEIVSTPLEKAMQISAPVMINMIP